VRRIALGVSELPPQAQEQIVERIDELRRAERLHA